ncbi:hypothetical protein C2E21_0645 [Chlorella sorokiniana]|uniref:Uncharacterized protein n=1 Tax=Chlorella sorokiniana TaxID=3076 RepID=A0A2P6U460_CHLSO|nr:hypothetical protein C2E21_0645 [Chlorella sorokiniana]|eukprot:PRW61104.1 hypothetical protein C2E21_0645 [Chlorella sorokiniana]
MSADEAGECRLLVGPAAWTAQVLLALLAVAALAYKRHVEHPRRPVKVWGLDVSKQGISMLAAHICGMLIALIAQRAATAHSSECAWYFMAFTFDTTLGLLLTILLHKAALRCAAWYGRRAAQRLGSEELQPVVGLSSGSSAGSSGTSGDRWFEVLQACGNYGDPPSYRRWAIQLAEWVACVVLARGMCGTIVLLLGPVLIYIAQGLDSLFEGHPTLLLYTVMVCCPLAMNLCQALIQDVVLKWRSPSASSAAGGNDTSDPDLDGRTSLAMAEVFSSSAPFRSLAGQGAAPKERAAALVKLGSSRPGLQARQEGSLLGPADQRSDAPGQL